MNHSRMGMAVMSLLLAGAMGCEKKPSPEALQAQEVAKKAEERVAALEKQLQETKDAKPGKAGNGDAEQISKAHAKALEKQLADVKRSAEAKKKAAQEMATQPSAPSKPATITVEVPAGTPLQVKLAKDLTTESVQAGDGWNGSLIDTVTIEGRTVWPAGTKVSGVVTQSTAAGRLSSGNGGLGIKLTMVGSHDVEGGTYVVSGGKRGERNAKFIGGGAALGALVGILSDKKNQGDHALGGAAIGAAAGTAAAAATADTIIKMEAAKPVKFALAASESVTLKP